MPVRRRPAERLASAMIFAAFVAVAALVGVICVSSLNAAYQDERDTENLLHDARAFVPAKTGGTLPVDSFEAVQQPNRNEGNELNRLYRESAHHNWAGHDFDVAFVTGDGGAGQEAASSPGRTQQLTNIPRPVHAIDAHVPSENAHGKRVWGWLHKDKPAAAGQESSSAIQENLDKQADYIIGYPDLGKDEAARTQRLVGISRMHKVQSLGTLPPLGGNEHAESVKNAQEAVKFVKGFINRAPGDVPTFKVPGQDAVHTFISGSRFDEATRNASPAEKGANQDATSDAVQNAVVPSGRAVVISRPPPGVPVVVAMPHQVGIPTVTANVKIVSSPASGTPSSSKHVPFAWVKANGLGRKGGADAIPLPDGRSREEKYEDHATRVSKAAMAAEAAREIVANGEEGKACFQEGHGSEPCPTIDYHPKAGEEWNGAPDRPRHPETPEAESAEDQAPATSESQEAPAETESQEPSAPQSEESTGIDWPTPGESPAPQGPGGLNVEHEHFGPDISKEDDDDDEGLPQPTGVEHEHFEGIPPVPLSGQESAPATGENTGTGPADDLNWPAPADNNVTSAGQGSYLTATVKRLESVVGELSGMMEKVLGAAPSQNVYVTNNYNNVTVQTANISSATSSAQPYIQPYGSRGRAPLPVVIPPPTPLPYPEMWPLGGVYADQVVVNLDDDVNGSALYYSINATGEQGTPMEYTAPFVLGPGWTKVEAVAIKAGYNASAVREAVFHVMDCNGDKCCNWRVVYLRFEAILGRLLARKKEIPENQIAREHAKDAAEVEWLNAESKVQDAKISIKSAQQGAEYAHNYVRKWGYAFSASQDDLDAMEKKVTTKLRELLDERELIMDILAKLDSEELSASTAMGMVQQSLAQCSACKAWRSIASSPTGDGAATTFALASTLGGHQEVKDVKAILQEILDDLNARRALYEKMLSGARVQVLDNEQKLHKWTAEASEMAAEVYKDEKKMQDYGRKSQEFAGKVQVEKQKVERGKQFMQDEMDILDRHISAIRRILKRIRVALGNCPGGAPEERYPTPPAPPASAPAEASGNRMISSASQFDDSDSKESLDPAADPTVSSTFPLEKAADDDDWEDGLVKEEDDIKRFIAAEPEPATTGTKSGNRFITSSSQYDDSKSKGSEKASSFGTSSGKYSQPVAFARSVTSSGKYSQPVAFARSRSGSGSLSAGSGSGSGSGSGRK